MSCKNLTDYYINEPSELSGYTCDPQVIAKRSFLKHISGVYTVDDEYVPPLSEDWYPQCNSFYPCTEDVDAINRVDHLLAAKKFLDSFTTIKTDDRNNFDAYNELDSQIKYLQSKPATFLILGKPGIGEQELGKLLSEHWKCVYIDPETLVEEEIRSGSRAGQCIEFNLRCGRAISVDVILRLVEKRVKSKSAQHRGFVICGFPLIRNDMYQEDPVSSESAIFTVQEIFEEILEPIGKTSQIIRNVSKTSQLSKEDVEEEEQREDIPEQYDELVAEDGIEEESPVEIVTEKPSMCSIDIGSAASEIFKVTDVSTNYAAQLNFLFSLCHEPLVIIYIMCQNYDVVTKHEHYRYNLKDNKVINLMKDQGDSIIYTIYTKTPGFDNEDLPDDLYETSDYTAGLSSSDLMYLTYLPCNFSGNVQAQLEQYRFDALPTIEKHVLLHNPQFFIKVDGRLSLYKMFNIIKAKLKILPLPRVFVPEKLIEPTIPTGAEDEVLDTFDYENATPEEAFDLLKRKKIINRLFKLRWSRWGSTCPVAMKEGTYTTGKAALAVKFLNHIYFLSDEISLLKFIRNPRPYLLPPYPRPTCKILIIGPYASGKSAVAKGLALLLNGQVLESAALQQEYRKQRGKEHLEKIRTDAINEAIQMLSEKNKIEYEEGEKTRLEKKQKWISRTKDMLAQLLLLERTLTSAATSAISSFPQKRPVHMPVNSLESVKLKDDLARIQSEYADLELPVFDDMVLVDSLDADPSGLDDYMPAELRYPIPPPQPVSIFDEFVTKYADENVERASILDYEMTLEDTGDMYVSAIREVEEQNIQAGEHHGGWVLVGVPPAPEILEQIFDKYLPDDVLVFRDPDGTFLLERYKIFGQNEFKDYQDFFEKIGRTSIAQICPSVSSTQSYRTRLARRVVDEILISKQFDDVLHDEEYGEDEEFEVDAREVGFVDEDYFASRATRLELKRYEAGLQYFENECEKLYDYFDDIGIGYKEFIVTDKSLEELMKEVISEISKKYQYFAHALTPEDRVEEVEDIGEREVVGEEFDEEGEEKAAETSGNFMQNRRLGDTNVYCPVSYKHHGVLWKGKEEYAALYNGKLYFMATELALEKFLSAPQDYILKKPIKVLPPPRICIVGVAGSGKTTLGKALSLALGLHYVTYESYLKRALDAEHIEGNLETLLSHGTSPEVEALSEYLDNDEPLSDELLTKMNVEEAWFDEPKRSVGFILDAFPKRPSDITYIEEHNTIPDIVLELSTADMDVNQRYVQVLLQEWQEFTQKAQEQQDLTNHQILIDWDENRQHRIDELMENRRQARYQAKMEEKREKQDKLGTIKEKESEGDITDHSQISYDSVAEEADLEEVRAFVDSEFPEPTFDENWETLEEATERIVEQTEANFKADIEYLRTLKEYFENHLIEWVALDASMSIPKVFDEAMRAIDKHKFRNRSLFERCYDVTVEIAEKLLTDGYHFLSRFGKACPVQVYEKANSVLMYYPLEQKMELFPIIHRNYIYFLAGRKNRDKFCNDPLFYILQSDVTFPIIPYRIAIIGPPKCGKTVLAERFKRELGLKSVSIGQAARYVLRFLPLSRLAREMEFVLRNGWELTSEMMMRCVEAMSFDGRGITQGLVFDGFPNTRYDVDHLAALGLIPHLVIHLDATVEEIHMFLSTDKGKKGLPIFSQKFIDRRCEDWFKNVHNICDWLDKEYQVWTKLKVTPSKWGVWKAAYDLASAAMFEIKYYYKNCYRDMALHLANMQITPAEFKKRRSCYKHFCPSCLYYHNVLVNGGDPPDRTGLIQFKNNYYWLCPEHIDEFANDPESYLPPYNDKVLPGDLPLQVVLTEKPINCYENGICIVCYWDSKYEKIFRPGLIQYACSYKDKIYLFDTNECMLTFVNQPHRYFSKTVSFKTIKAFASLEMGDLPTLGMLEQYTVRNVIKAVTNISTTRPLLAGLDIEKSAAIGLALHLKINNPNTPKEFLPLYEEAYKLFNKRRMQFINTLARMKHRLNPYIHYEEPLEKLVLPSGDIATSEKGEYSVDESILLESIQDSLPTADKTDLSLLQHVMLYLEPE
ncbi:nucleotide kinase [Holotrichia oblita]|uniref:Nucleotide kinase n=1 Tax=Holotrichia oblita TaxID=644536 RepID=A0ACB9T2P2_HOLOL|nr:nucleotide kinase [Holotrichia oblita]